MITDLQGTVNLLSDPAIHSSNRQLFNERTNLSDEGIHAFYGGDPHNECNQLCKLLKLRRPEHEEFEDFDTNSIDRSHFCYDEDEIDIVCDFCQHLSTLQYSVYQQKMKSKNWNVECEDCQEQMEYTIQITCDFAGCRKKFPVKKYFYDMMGIRLPKKCKDCRNDVDDKCFYCNQLKTVPYKFWNE